MNKTRRPVSVIVVGTTLAETCTRKSPYWDLEMKVSSGRTCVVFIHKVAIREKQF